MFVSCFGNDDIIFNAEPDVTFLNVDTNIYGEHHARGFPRQLRDSLESR